VTVGKSIPAAARTHFAGLLWQALINDPTQRRITTAQVAERLA
jgi:hypothetical protein